MSNDSLGNGDIPTHHLVQHVKNIRSNDKSKKAPDIAAIENKNWLLHRHFTRHEYKLSKNLIDKELVNSHGHNEYANYLKGIILRREGKVQESLDAFQNSYNVNPTNVNNVKQIAKSFHKRAIDAYLEAEKMSNIPDWEIHHSLGECYLKLNQIYDAECQFKKSTELTKNSLPYLSLGSLYKSNDKINEAIQVYENSLKGSPDNLEIAEELGLVYLENGDVHEAFQQFGTILAHSPGCARIILPLAFIIQNNDEYDVALSKYKSAAQTISESSSLWNNIGMCFFDKKKFVAAISCLKRAHYLNPMALFPACNLGKVLLTTGQPASAAIYLCAAIAAAPKNPMPYLLLGLALKKLDDLEGAEKALSKSHSLTPQDPLVLINYAVILYEVEKYKDARDILSALQDITTIINVETEIVQVAKNLSRKLDDKLNYEENRILIEDEV
ncbi:hypothetical protein HCN44_011095 [Aphidius gifuensis]|uniref:Bardet-Biedl syndrome 4 protein n=1 Tax=Aphidius gifuensis TaxID=684658 RepID=A0A834XZN8_APHGI|nr:Bardet-Biedl syndrome 4 protein isoform X2 [Aphidius gifuensis]KAF7993826.1 hypothetical protein HCN44_011095 [Aphidius gifuensis]